MPSVITADKPGSLTIVGSGIESIGQMTLQALSYIEAASKVFYCVIDPATEAFIRSKNKNCVDLYKYYDNGKPRINTYVQMAEVMLREVRAGLDVVGVFYGHPGVFVNPSHRALAIAREEGYRQRMLPGVSAEDCLYADLCIDPSNPGCVTYEASDFLLRDRPVVTTSHLIIFQVGCVGITDFSFKGFDNKKFGVLVDRLEREYGPEHPVVHYIGAVMPHEDPVTDKWTIAQLHEPEIQKLVGGVSTFYIPPKGRQELNREIVDKMELLPVGGTPNEHAEIYPSNRWKTPTGRTTVSYEPAEIAAIAQLEKHVAPEEYQPLDTSEAMANIMTTLALNPKELFRYKTDRASFAQSVPDLSAKERVALEAGDSWSLRCAMKKIPASLLDYPSSQGAAWIVIAGIVGLIGSVV